MKGDPAIPSTPLPEPLVRFIYLFNRGEYFESHEVLEHAWLVNRSPFYRGLIIYAAAYVKRDRASPRGVRLNLQKACRYLEPFEPHHLGLDVAALLRKARAVLGALRELGDPHRLPEEKLHALFPSILLRPDPWRIKGDEPEWAGP